MIMIEIEIFGLPRPIERAPQSGDGYTDPPLIIGQP